MSEGRRIDRRTLFDAFRRSTGTPLESTDRPPRSSLVGFYEERDRAGEVTAEIPRFTIRAGLPAVVTVPAYAEPIGPDTKRPT